MLAGFVQAAVPVLVALAVAAVLVAAAWAGIRLSRRSGRARRAAAQARARAGERLVRLDDVVAELDAQAEVSGTDAGGPEPALLHRAHITARRVRDEEFAAFFALDDAAHAPYDAQRLADRIAAHATQALDLVARARRDEDSWAADPPQDRLHGTRMHVEAARTRMGDPRALIAGLAERFDRSEWADAAAAAAAARTALDDATALLDRAASDGETRSMQADVELARRRLREAESREADLAHAYRLLVEASQDVADQIAAARSVLRDTGDRLDEPGLADEIAAGLAQAARDAARRPAAASDAVADLRERLDDHIVDEPGSGAPARRAHSALPGAVAAAERAIAASRAASGASIDARLVWASANEHLARAQQSAAPVDALEAARTARRRARDAARAAQ